MPFPLVPFVAGAVAGGLGIWLLRNDALRADVRDAAEVVASQLRQGIDRASDVVSEGVDALRRRGAAAASAPAEPEPTARRSRASKKKVSNKAAGKKTAGRKVASRAEGEASARAGGADDAGPAPVSATRKRGRKAGKKKTASPADDGEA